MRPISSPIRRHSVGLRIVFGLLCGALLAAPARAQQAVGPQFTVSAGFEPRVASDAAGNFVVVGGFSDVVAQRFNSTGVPLGAGFQVNTFTTGNQGDATVAVAAAGSFVVVWDSDGQDGSDLGIYGQRYNASGVPQGVEFPINTTTAGRQGFPVVAGDAAGNFVVVWQAENNQDGSGVGIVARRFNAAGAPLSGEFQVNTTFLGDQRVPTIAADAAGNFVVVFQEETGLDGSGIGVFGQRYNAAGVAQGGQFQVNTTTAGDQGIPALAYDAGGNFIVVWQDENGVDGDQAGVFGRRYNAAGTPLGGQFQINSFTAGRQVTPEATFDPAGNFIVSWGSEDQVGDGFSVFAQRYNAAGVPQGAEFLVNSTFSRFESFPDLAPTSGGDWVIVFLGGQTFSVYGQRFTVGAPNGACAPTPMPCRTPAVSGKASIALKDVSDDRKDTIQWKWIKGAATTVAEFGSPTTTDDYALCVYGGGNLRSLASAPAGGLCAGKQCWKAKTKGFDFKDKNKSNAGGMEKLQLKEGIDGKAQIQVKAVGDRVLMPPTLSLTSPLTVQLVNKTSGLCWSAQYGFPPVTKQTATSFKDKAD